MSERKAEEPTGPSGLTAETRRLIKELMAEQHLSANALSKKAGVARRTVDYVVDGTRVPTMNVVDRLFAGLGYEVALVVTPNPLILEESRDQSDIP